MHNTSIQLIPRARAQKGKTNITALVIVVLVGIAAIGAVWIIGGSQKVTQENILATQPSLKTKLDTISKSETPSQIYYVMKTNNAAETSIYQYNFDPAHIDTLSLKHEGDLSVLDTDSQNHTWLAKDTDRLYIIDPAQKKEDELVKAPVGFSIFDAKFSHDRSRIAYTVDNATATTEADVAAPLITHLYIYIIATKKSVMVFERTDLAKYKSKTESRRIVLEANAWSQDDAGIIATVNVSDLGGVSDGERFVIDLKNNNAVRSLTVPTAQKLMFIASGGVSPDGTSIVYIEDARLMIMDVASGQTKVLHRYNADDFGPGAGATLSVVFSTLWKDDSSGVYFSTPHGIFQIEKKQGSRTPVFLFDGVQDAKNAIRLDKLGDYVVFNQQSSPISADVLLDIKTGKTLLLSHPRKTDAVFLTFLAS